MTKIGKGEFQPPQPPDMNKELKASSEKFKQYLSDFKTAEIPSDKELAKDRMKSELSLMDLAAKQVRKETKVQEQKVAKDFAAFDQNPTDRNLEALEHDFNAFTESLD